MIKPYINISYGELLRLFRRKKGLSQKAVADKLSVTHETINNYETNRTVPGYAKMIMLERLYGLEFETLSKHLRTNKSETIKKNAAPLRFTLEAPMRYHGKAEEIVRKKRRRRYLFI